MLITKQGFIEAIIAHGIFVLVGFAYQYSKKLLEQASPIYRKFALISISSLYILSNIISNTLDNESKILLFIISTVFLFWIFFIEINAFWIVGLIGADKSALSGFSYKKALNNCKNSIDFLGIGANKLIKETTEFENALKRCNRQEKPMRFLLCEANSETLKNAARLAGKPENEYQEIVRETLRILRKQIQEKSRNIEVRIYSDIPIFRMMFINDETCIIGHYVLGEGDGSQLPQLHVRKRIMRKRDNESLYHPLKMYFETQWKEAKPWNQSDYLN